ncbi:MAG: ABC transporter permease [Candidatus Dormibacteria bacterium]
MDLVGIRPRAWRATWPKLAALLAVVAVWELAVVAGWRSRDLLPPPEAVLARTGGMLADGNFYRALATTLGRAALGFLLATAGGALVGVGCALSSVLRSAVGALITGLQSFPSIVWAPFALLIFVHQPEQAILFVVVMGAAPSVANGLIVGVDHVAPATIQAGRVLGARGLWLYHQLVLPASMPYFLGGLRQGWAYGWRSLMSAELIVFLVERPSVGAGLQAARVHGDMPTLLALMAVILVVGIATDQFFAYADRRVREQHGLLAREQRPG